MPESATEPVVVPLRQLVRRAPVSCSPDTPVAAVLRTLRDEAIGSMVVVDAGRAPIGILTLRDVVDRIALEPGALQRAVADFMTPRPATLTLDDTTYQAALTMVRHGVRHVVLVDGGRLAGLVSERDLFGLQSTGVRHLSTAIRSASDAEAVRHFGRDIVEQARQMVERGVAVGPLTAFVASLNDLLTERIVEMEMQAAGAALDGIRWCWILMGSEGRGEQTLVTDQDNGIVFAAPGGMSAVEARERLLPHAQRVNRALAAAGYTLCPGDIMAGNPSWCLEVGEWIGRFARWLDSGSPEALLHGAIFFDLRALTGAIDLAAQVRGWLLAHAPKNPRFLHQMTANALRNRPPLGWMRDFTTAADGSIDLKLNGTTPFVDAGRILSLACGLDEVGTAARLRTAGERLGVAAGEVQAWIGAFHHVQGCRLRRQADRIAAGEVPDNRLVPSRLNDFDRDVLKLALVQGRTLQKRLALDYGV